LNIILAGIPRSGSTRLFNIVRLGLLQHFPAEYLNCHWITTFQHKENCHNLLKVHVFDQRWIDYADFVFTTKRDIRYIAASAYEHNLKKANCTIDGVIKSMHSVLEMHALWNEHSDFEVVYEKFDDHSEEIINGIFSKIGLPVDVKKVLTDLSEIRNAKEYFNDDGVSLMHTNHISPKTHLSYKERLPRPFHEKLDLVFNSWLQENGYVGRSSGFKFI